MFYSWKLFRDSECAGARFHQFQLGSYATSLELWWELTSLQINSAPRP